MWTISDVLALSPIDFEELVAGLFRTLGYEVTMTEVTGDQGVDLHLQRGDERSIAQCKRYRGTVGQSQIRDFYGTLMHEGAKRGYVVTTGVFSLAALSWATDKPIALVDGPDLLAALNEQAVVLPRASQAAPPQAAQVALLERVRDGLNNPSRGRILVLGAPPVGRSFTGLERYLMDRLGLASRDVAMMEGSTRRIVSRERWSLDGGNEGIEFDDDLWMYTTRLLTRLLHDHGRSALADDITEDATTLRLVDASAFPSSGEGEIRHTPHDERNEYHSESITWSWKEGSTLGGVVRAPKRERKGRSHRPAGARVSLSVLEAYLAEDLAADATEMTLTDGSDFPEVGEDWPCYIDGADDWDLGESFTYGHRVENVLKECVREEQWTFGSNDDTPEEYCAHPAAKGTEVGVAAWEEEEEEEEEEEHTRRIVIIDEFDALPRKAMDEALSSQRDLGAVLVALAWEKRIPMVVQRAFSATLDTRMIEWDALAPYVR